MFVSHTEHVKSLGFVDLDYSQYIHEVKGLLFICFDTIAIIWMLYIVSHPLKRYSHIVVNHIKGICAP